MRSSLAWCLEPEWNEREPGSRSYVRKTAVRQNYSRIMREAPLLLAQGMTGVMIAAELGVSADSVWRALREQGFRRGK